MYSRCVLVTLINVYFNEESKVIDADMVEKHLVDVCFDKKGK